MSNSTRQARIQASMEAMRAMSATATITRQLFAEEAGMHPTDAECIDYLRQKGPLTAGEIAKLSHLSKGAVTAMIYRLQKQGFVQTSSDPKDKRRVVVSVIPDKLDSIVKNYKQLAAAIYMVLDSFDDEQLQVIEHFNEQLSRVYEDAAGAVSERQH